MADNVTANAGSGGATFRAYAEAGGVEHPASVCEYVTTLSAGANVLQPVQLTTGLPVQPQTGSTWAVTQSGSWTISGTVAISAASLPLPAGAAQDSTLTGGTAKAIVRGGQKGATNANADITHTAEGADHEALDVQVYHGGAAVNPTAIRALTATDVVTAQVTQIGGAAVSMSSGGGDSGTQRVVLANTGNGIIPVSQSGSWAVTLASTSPVNVTQWGGVTVSLNNGTTDTGTLRVTLSSDSTGQVALAAGTNLIGKVSASAETGTVYNGTTALTPLFATIAASSSGASQVVALVGGKRIRVLALYLVANAAVNVKWQSHVTPTDLTGLAYLAANGGCVLPFNPAGWFQTVSGEALDINLSGAIAVGGALTYVTV